MQLVRENINFERGKDPKASMGVGDPWMIGLNHSREGIAILSAIELFGDREIVPAKAPKKKGDEYKVKEWADMYVRNEFPFYNDSEFKEVKNLYKERMNRPWPGSLTITKSDRYGIYKTFRFDWAIQEAFKKGMEYLTENKHYIFGFGIWHGSYGLRMDQRDFEPGDTYRKIFDYSGECFREELNKELNK
jgi:hypothetical protein